ncbi:MAG: serine/threonine protein kinase [Bryobacteraceae bacterium]
MTNKWARVRDVFARASELPEGEAWIYLERTCAGDPSMLDEVRGLLDAERQSVSFLAAPAAARFDPERPERLIGQRLGPYIIRRELGAGGMGAVYLADRADDEFQKQVALKLLLPGKHGGEMIRRFRQERQILAKLEHAGIARLLDGGTTDDGTPFLVMEYVDGKPIHAYCADNNLSIRARLALMRKICLAVQYAHQKLVVHRDLKPSNILVTEDGEPRLLDFGIAKLTGAAEDMGLTRTGAIAATPEYASPEQIGGGTVGIGSDIYSLGVLLYRLLVKKSPYGLGPDASFTELMLAIQGTDPVRPSSVEAGIGADLDAILLMALEKDPAARYASANEFADDIQRYLDNEPVKAQPSTAIYQIRKFIRRKPAIAAAALIAAMSLAGGAGVATWQAHRANQERDRAERRFQELRTLANFFVFDFNDSIASLPGAMKAREMIVRKGLESLDRLSNEAGGDVKLLGELASAYERIGDVYGNFFVSNTGNYKAAQPSYRKAVELREKILAGGAGPQEKFAYARTLARSADGFVNAGLMKEALRDCEKSAQLFAELATLPDLRLAALNEQVTLFGRISIIKFASGQASAGLEHANKQLATAEILLNDLPEESSKRQYLTALGSHGNALRVTGKLAEGEKELREAIRLMGEALGRNAGDVVVRRLRVGANLYLSLALTAQRRDAEAFAPMQAAMEEAAKLSAADSGDQRLRTVLANIRTRMVRVYEKEGRRTEARQVAADNLAELRQIATRPESSPDDWNVFADAVMSCPYPELARPEEAVAFARKAVNESGGTSLIFRVTLAESLEKAGKRGEAADVAKAALAAFPPAPGAASKEREILLAIIKRAGKK